MKPIEVSQNIYELSVNVENILFEEMWEIPDGVAVNSYIVKGEKTAIIDGLCGWDGIPETLFALLDELKIAPDDIDYLIINHMEPDHTGWIESFKKITQAFEVVCTEKAGKLLSAFYDQNVNVRIVKEGDQLDLGNGKTLTFFEVPNCHWPETMMTLEEESKTLFTCDLYGTFGKIMDSPFDDEIESMDAAYLESNGLRYYSNVMNTFASFVKKAIEKTKLIDYKCIAPGHGLVWRTHPEKIVENYERYSDYGLGKAESEITIIWGSMYGMTEKVVREIEQYLKEIGQSYTSLRVPKSSIGEILTYAIKSKGLIIAAPTYEYHLFPPMVNVLDELGKKKIIQRNVFCFGSFGWSGGGQKEIDAIVERCKLKWTMIEPIVFKGSAREEEIEKIKVGVDQLIKSMEI